MAVVLAGCGQAVTTQDGGRDLAIAVDLTVLADLASTDDLAVADDIARADLAQPRDMVGLQDMTQQRDMTLPPTGDMVMCGVLTPCSASSNPCPAMGLTCINFTCFGSGGQNCDLCNHLCYSGAGGFCGVDGKCH